MAIDYLDNPRRFPRVAARLQVGVSTAAGGFVGTTEDLGPGGCLLVVSRPLEVGAAVRLAIGGGESRAALAVAGKVAWVRPDRHGAGVSFEGRQSGAAAPQAWFQRLLASEPTLAARVVKAPERLHLDAPVYLLAPPRHIVDFTTSEAEILRNVDNGATLRQVLGGGLVSRPELARAVFALFEKRALTQAMGQSAPAWQWKEILSRLEEEGLVEAAPRPALAARPAVEVAARAVVEIAAPAAQAYSPPVLFRTRTTPVARPMAPVSVAVTELAPEPVVEPTPEPTPLHAARPAASRPARPPVAQQALDQARRAVDSGDVHTALGLLRRAMGLAPRDAEIASLLGQLAFRGRQA